LPTALPSARAAELLVGGWPSWCWATALVRSCGSARWPTPLTGILRPVVGFPRGIAILAGVTWWQTLLVAVVPVLVTLIVTSWAESRRRREDADQREKERKAQDAHREQERRRAVQDAWRTDKLQAHRELMFFARRLWRCFVEAGREVQELQRVHSSHGQELTPQIQEHLRRIHDAFRPLDDAAKEMDSILTTVQCSALARLNRQPLHLSTRT
jgi:uncharacterized membrane protein